MSTEEDNIGPIADDYVDHRVASLLQQFLQWREAHPGPAEVRHFGGDFCYLEEVNPDIIQGVLDLLGPREAVLCDFRVPGEAVAPRVQAQIVKEDFDPRAFILADDD